MLKSSLKATYLEIKGWTREPSSIALSSPSKSLVEMQVEFRLLTVEPLLSMRISGTRLQLYSGSLDDQVLVVG